MQLELGKADSATVKVGETTADADSRHQPPGDLGDDGMIQGRGMRVRIVRYRGGFETEFGAGALRRSRRVSGLSPAGINLVPEGGLKRLLFDRKTGWPSGQLAGVSRTLAQSTRNHAPTPRVRSDNAPPRPILIAARGTPRRSVQNPWRSIPGAVARDGGLR